MRRRIPAALALALLAACSPSTNADPTPSATATPTQTATPDPSTDPLYLEAVEVYKAYFAEMGKSEVAGYPEPTLPARYDKYLTGKMKKVVGEAWVDGHASGLHIDRAPVLRLVAPNPGAKHSDSVVSLRICSDGSGSRVLDSKNRDQGAGAIVLREVFFSRVGGQLKGSFNEAKEVSACPAR